MGKIVFISSVLYGIIVFLDHAKSIRVNKKNWSKSYPTNIITKRSMILGIILRIGLVIYWFVNFFILGDKP
jgi:hypothetical protein